MAYNFQYQAKTQPVLLIAASITWFMPLAEPVRDQAFEVVSDVSTFTVPVAGATVALDWYLPLSEPIKDPSFEVSSNVRTFVVPGQAVPSAANWDQPWSEPTRLKSGVAVQQSNQSQSVFLVTPPVSLDWYLPIVDPVKDQPFEVSSDVGTFVVPIAGFNLFPDKWSYPWSEPVRQKPGLGVQQQQAAWLVKAAPFEVVYEDKWHQPWSEPTRRKSFAAYQQTVAYGPVPIVAEDKWHQPWSEPARRKPATTQQTLAYGLAPTAAVTPIDWAQELYQPRLESFEVVSRTSVFSVPFNLFPDKWFEPWSEPSKPKSSIKTASQQVLAWSTNTPTAAAVTPIDWAQELYQPRPESFDVVSETSVFIVERPAVLNMGWQSCWPDRIDRKSLPTSAYQVTTHIPVKTFLPFGVVSQGPIFTQVTQYQSRSSFVPIVAPPPPVVPIDWAQEIYQPSPQSFDVVSDTSVFVVPVTPSVAPTDIKWQLRWPDRLYAKSLPVSAYQVTTHIPVRLFEPFSVVSQGPVFIQITPYQSAAVPPPIVTPPPVVTPIDWAQELSQLKPESYEVVGITRVFVALPPEIITEDKWHQPWSIPRRLSKLGLSTADQPFIAQTIVPPPVLISQWLYGLAEPVRLKPGLKAGLQQFFAAVPFIEDRKIYPKWGFPWSEPVREQAYEVSSSLVVFPFEFTPSHVTVTMSATEINGDVFSGLIKIYRTPARCLVSIKEIKIPQQNLSSIHEVAVPTQSLSSIEEVPAQIQGLSSIKETET